MTAKYEPAVVPSGRRLAGGAPYPAGVVPAIVAGTGTGVTNAAGLLSFTIPGLYPAGVVVAFLPQVTAGSLQDIVLTVGARDGRSVNIWAARAGAPVVGNLGFTYLAVVA